MIREMLLRVRYTGSLVWGKAAKTYRGGTKVRLQTDESEQIRTTREDLRIVPQELWERVQATMLARETPWKAGAVGRVPKHLLAGLGRCAECGGSMLVMSAKHGNEIKKLYGCSHNHNRGEAVCSNKLKRPMLDVDRAVVDWVQANMLSESVIADALIELRQRLAARSEAPNAERGTRRAPSRGEAHPGRAGPARLCPGQRRGIADHRGGRGRAGEALGRVRARLQVLALAPSVLDLEVRRLEREARARAADFQGLLSRNVVEARKALEALFSGPPRFTPVETNDGRRYEISGAAAVGVLCTTESVPKGIRI